MLFSNYTRQTFHASITINLPLLQLVYRLYDTSSGMANFCIENALEFLLKLCRDLCR